MELNAKHPISKDNLILVLSFLVFHFFCQLYGDIRESMATTTANASELKAEGVRFAGYDGMTQQVLAMMIKIGTMEKTLERIENKQCIRKDR